MVILLLMNFTNPWRFLLQS